MGEGQKFAPIPGVLVIGLGHRARHGKDTVAAALVKDVGATRFSFADDLYAYCRIAHGMKGKDAPLLQHVGVAMRESNPDVWIESVYTKMLADDQMKIAVITDMRFPNEMAFVKALGGVTVRVNRLTTSGDLFVDPSRPANHISETALADATWDYTINAVSGDLGALRWAGYHLASFLKAQAR